MLKHVPHVKAHLVTHWRPWKSSLPSYYLCSVCEIPRVTWLECEQHGGRVSCDDLRAGRSPPSCKFADSVYRLLVHLSSRPLMLVHRNNPSSESPSNLPAETTNQRSAMSSANGSSCWPRLKLPPRSVVQVRYPLKAPYRKTAMLHQTLPLSLWTV